MNPVVLHPNTVQYLLHQIKLQQMVIKMLTSAPEKVFIPVVSKN